MAFGDKPRGAMNGLYQDTTYQLGDLMLGPFDAVEAARMGARLAAIDPWLRLGIDAARLADMFAARPPCTRRFLVSREGQAVAALSLRAPWLFGPYVELLAVLPEAQGQGIGGVLLRWIEAEARAECRNLWLAVSAFNTNAIAFYERHGFERTALLGNLVRQGFDEVLFRKVIG